MPELQHPIVSIAGVTPAVLQGPTTPAVPGTTPVPYPLGPLVRVHVHTSERLSYTGSPQDYPGTTIVPTRVSEYPEVDGARTPVVPELSRGYIDVSNSLGPLCPSLSEHLSYTGSPGIIQGLPNPLRPSVGVSQKAVHVQCTLADQIAKCPSRGLPWIPEVPGGYMYIR